MVLVPSNQHDIGCAENRMCRAHEFGVAYVSLNLVGGEVLDSDK